MRSDHVMMRMMRESTALSVTTVPRAFGNEVPSHRFSIAHLVNSPILGITNEAAYEINME